MTKRTPWHPRAAQRPVNPSIFPAGWIYFKRWWTLRWFLLLLIPIAQSVLGAVLRGRHSSAIGIGIFGLAVAAALFVALVSGTSVSRQGTYSRAREPAPYWFGVAILGLAYIGICMSGWVIK